MKDVSGRKHPLWKRDQRRKKTTFPEFFILFFSPIALAYLIYQCYGWCILKLLSLGKQEEALSFQCKLECATNNFSLGLSKFLILQEPSSVWNQKQVTVECLPKNTNFKLMSSQFAYYSSLHCGTAFDLSSLKTASFYLSPQVRKSILRFLGF